MPNLIMFRKALDKSADSVFIINYPSFKLVDVNETACIELAYTREELLELELFHIIPYMSLDELKEKFERASQCSLTHIERDRLNSCHEKFETYQQRKDGSNFPVEIFIHLVDNVHQTDEWLFIASVRNITERKKAEREIKKYTRKLIEKNEEIEGLYKKLNEEINKARQIHERTFISETPVIPGVSLASHFYPAERLGGDFYSFIKSRDKLVLYLSDVSGHGMDATIISVFVKETIESYASLKPDELEPKKIMNHIINQYLKDNYPDDYFVCIFLAVLDLETHELTYTSAGFHNPPLIKYGMENNDMLVNGGLPISSSIPRELMDTRPGKTLLPSPSTIFLSTDGIYEQENSEGCYEERLKEVFYKNGHFPPELIKIMINEDLREFNNGSLQGEDDITYVIMQLEEERKKEFDWELESSFCELNRLNDEIFPVIKEYVDEECVYQGLYEIVVNAMEHGNKFDREKKVSVKFIATGSYKLSIIEDQGRGFDWRKEKYKSKDIDHERERGRGIIMAQLICHDLYYNDKGNKAYLIIDDTKES